MLHKAVTCPRVHVLVHDKLTTSVACQPAFHSNISLLQGKNHSEINLVAIQDKENLPGHRQWLQLEQVHGQSVFPWNLELRL